MAEEHVGTQDELDMREALSTYVGKNVKTYNRLFRIYAEETEENPVGFKPSFTLGGLLLPWAWLWYRKFTVLAFLRCRAS